MELELPAVEGFEIQSRLCPRPGDTRSAHERSMLGYPEVNRFRAGLRVRATLDYIAAGASSVSALCA